jgi:hypothetical protein
MNKLSLAGLAALLVLLPSCLPESKQPISNLETARQDFELHGLWVATRQDGGKSYLHVGAQCDEPLLDSSPAPEEGLMRFCIVYQDVKTGALSKPFGMSFFVSKVGNDHYANLAKFADRDDTARTITYWFYKYRVAGDRLDTWGMNLKHTARVVESGRLKGEVVRRKDKPDQIESVLITDTQANIQALLRDPASAELFPDEAKTSYVRVR